jgi:phosphoserine aminotransferase
LAETKDSVAPPFAQDSIEHSSVVRSIGFRDDVEAALMAKILRANGVVDTEPYRKLGRNQLRIAMFPSIDLEGVTSLCACINYVVGDL